MPNKKISELISLIDLSDDDYIQIIDDSELDLSLKNKRVLISALKDKISESSVKSVSGIGVDNTDPLNPIISFVGAAYSNVTSRFTFVIVLAVPSVPVPSGEVHYDANTNILYFSITDLDGNANHQIIIGKSDVPKAVNIVMTSGQWDQVTDNLSVGVITSDDVINNPDFVEVLADYITDPSIFSDGVELNISLSISEKSTSTTASNGLSKDGDDVIIGGELDRETILLGNSNGLSLGKVANPVGYLETNSDGGMWMQNRGSGVNTGFMEFTGYDFSQFQVLSKDGLEPSFMNFSAGAAAAGNYFGFPHDSSDGRVIFTSHNKLTNPNNSGTRSSVVELRSAIDRVLDIRYGINSASTRELALSLSKTEGIVIKDILLGLGLNYDDQLNDEANVLAWGLAPNHIPSEERIIANTSGVITNGNGTTANGTSVDFGGPLTQPTDVTISGGNNLNLNATAGATLTLSSENGGNLNVRLQNSAGMDVDGTNGGGIRLHGGFASGTLMDIEVQSALSIDWTTAGWSGAKDDRYNESSRFISENGVAQTSRNQNQNSHVFNIDDLANGGQSSLVMTVFSGSSFLFRDSINQEGAGYADDYSVNGIANHGDNWITSKGYVDAAILSVSLPDGDKGDITVTLSGTQWDINADAIVTAKIADLAVTGNKILDGTISNSKLEDMVAGTIKGQDLATGAPKDLISSEVRSIINVSDGAEVNPDLVSQAEAEAGTSTVERTWTSERVNQAITASNINKWISASNLSNFNFAAIDTSEVIPISNTNDGNGVTLDLNEFSFDEIGLYQMNAHFNVENGSNPNNSTISVFMEAFDGVSWIPQINSNRTISIDSGETKPIDLILPINILDVSTKVRLSGNVSSLTVSLSFDNLTIPVSPSVSVSIIKQ